MTGEASEANVSVEEREGLTLERYAEVMAHVRHFPRADRAEVLARLELTGQRWESTVLAWTEALAEESAREEEALSILFGTTFARTRARLKEEQPTLPSLGLLPEKKVAVVAIAPVAIEAPPSIVPEPVAPRVEVPSYILTASASASAPTGPPLAPPRTVPTPMHHPARVAGAPLPDLRATMEASDFRGRPTLPFQAGGTSEQAFADVIARMTAAQGAPQDGSGKQSSAHLGATVGLAPSATGSVLPFAAEASGAAAPSWMPAGMLKLASVEGTHLSTDTPIGPALPFEPVKDSQVALENALAQAARLQGPAAGQTKGSAVSGTMGPRASFDLGNPELPFSSPSAPIPARVPALSIERYASLCVELTATPASAAQTLRRYQLTEPEWTALDAQWKTRLAREPGARVAWETACSAYRTWLAQAGLAKR